MLKTPHYRRLENAIAEEIQSINQTVYKPGTVIGDIILIQES